MIASQPLPQLHQSWGEGPGGNASQYSPMRRVFSAAGKMHSDLKKSSKDETLEASLFAMQNTD